MNSYTKVFWKSVGKNLVRNRIVVVNGLQINFSIVRWWPFFFRRILVVEDTKLELRSDSTSDPFSSIPFHSKITNVAKENVSIED